MEIFGVMRDGVGMAKGNLIEEVFGPPLEGRDCGGCTLCCTITKIDTPELSKEPGVPCAHLTERGCGIYESRFPVCHGFFCLWRRIEAMPEEARPDRCGVMFGHAGNPGSDNPFERFYIHALAADGTGVFDTPLLQGLLHMFAQGDVPVWISTEDGGRALVHPAPEIVSAVMSDEKAADRGLRTAARDWQSGTRKRRSGWLAHFLQ